MDGKPDTKLISSLCRIDLVEMGDNPEIFGQPVKAIGWYTCYFLMFAALGYLITWFSVGVFRSGPLSVPLPYVPIAIGVLVTSVTLVYYYSRE